MDFFERQEQARQQSFKLVPWLGMAVIGVLIAVNIVTLVVFFFGSIFFGFWSSVWAEMRQAPVEPWHLTLWRPHVALWASGVTLAIIFIGSALKMRQLAGGGRVVAEMLGGRRLNPATNNPDERRLLNVVQEMAIASGTPVPEIYILSREPGLNAFVAGHAAGDMVVAVTEGCVKYLTRDELQGVIAHEYSHLLNGDMRINLRLMGLVHGLFSITLLSYAVMERTYHERERAILAKGRRRGLGEITMDLVILAVGFLLAFIGFNGALFGRMVKSSVSRQREFLADAAAVQFTRYPEGLAGALNKAKIWPEGSVIHSAHAEEASHIFFNNGMDDERGTLIATHPPLEERIARVQTMMGRSYVAEEKTKDEPKDVLPSPPPREVARPALFSAPVPAPSSEPVESPAQPVAPAAVMLSVGVPAGQHLQYAAKLMAELPAPLLEAARDSTGASALVCGLLLSAVEKIRATQIEIVRAKTGAEVVTQLNDLAPLLSNLDVAARIPLVELAIPALRQLDLPRFEALMQTVQLLIRADERLELFEYALHRMLARHLTPHFKSIPAPEIRIHALSGVRYDCTVLLSALAYAGQSRADLVAGAFQAGVKTFNTTSVEFKLMPPEDCSVHTVDGALNNISETGPRLRKQILTACVQTVAADGLIHPPEAELLRAIADALDCPIPPFVSAA